GGGHGGEINGLEDLPVQPARHFAFERQPQQDEGVGQSLNAEPDGAMTEIGISRLFDRIEVMIDDLVEVLCDLVGYLVQLLVIEGAVSDKTRQGERGQVANGHLIRRGILDDLGTEIRASDSTEILL